MLERHAPRDGRGLRDQGDQAREQGGRQGVTGLPRLLHFFFVRLNSFFHIRSDKFFLQCVALLLCTVHGSIDAFRISDIFATRGFADSGSAGEYEQQAGHRYGGTRAFCVRARGRRAQAAR